MTAFQYEQLALHLELIATNLEKIMCQNDRIIQVLEYINDNLVES